MWLKSKQGPAHNKSCMESTTFPKCTENTNVMGCYKADVGEAQGQPRPLGNARSDLNEFLNFRTSQNIKNAEGGCKVPRRITVISNSSPTEVTIS